MSIVNKTSVLHKLKTNPRSPTLQPLITKKNHICNILQVFNKILMPVWCEMGTWFQHIRLAGHIRYFNRLYNDWDFTFQLSRDYIISYFNEYFMVKLFNNVIGAMSPWALVDIVFYHYVLYLQFTRHVPSPTTRCDRRDSQSTDNALHLHVFYTESQKHVLCIYFHTLPTIQQC